MPEEKLDPRVKRTRQLLEEAFSELIQEKDFQSISIQDITVRAGINRATFYAHFPDKYALLDYKNSPGFSRRNREAHVKRVSLQRGKFESFDLCRVRICWNDQSSMQIAARKVRAVYGGSGERAGQGLAAHLAGADGDKFPRLS
ncbi:MAG: TetR family transcriptional regulator [Anaerolineaceae bacterium]|nr:MAG: TetR family transcriptional regulator [Anaerolineaceae bacterium]